MCFAERRRMIRSRRDPHALLTLLAAARRVLIVCHGNIIRSPFATALISRTLGGHTGLSISSGGLGAVPGRSAHPAAILSARKHGIDLSEHAAAAVTAEAVGAADVIFVMDVPQLAAVRRRFPEGRSKTFLLTGLAADTRLEILDPFDGDETVCDECFAHIACAVRPIVNLLSAVALHA